MNKTDIIKLIDQAIDIHNDGCKNSYCKNETNDFCDYCPISESNKVKIYKCTIYISDPNRAFKSQQELIEHIKNDRHLSIKVIQLGLKSLPYDEWESSQYNLIEPDITKIDDLFK